VVELSVARVVAPLDGTLRAIAIALPLLAGGMLVVRL
jgi:hypothetical protein